MAEPKAPKTGRRSWTYYAVVFLLLAYLLGVTAYSFVTWFGGR